MTYYLFIWVCLRTILVICRPSQSVFTLLMYGIYADLLTWIRMWNRPVSTKQPTHQTTITDCNTHTIRNISPFCLLYSNKVGKGMRNALGPVFQYAGCLCNFSSVHFLRHFHASPLKTNGTVCSLWNITKNLNTPHQPESVSETLHWRVSTCNASLCMHSPATIMLWMDNGLVSYSWPDSPLPIPAHPFRLRSMLQSAISPRLLFNTRKGTEKYSKPIASGISDEQSVNICVPLLPCTGQCGGLYNTTEEHLAQKTQSCNFSDQSIWRQGEPGSRGSGSSCEDLGRICEKSCAVSPTGRPRKTAVQYWERKSGRCHSRLPSHRHTQYLCYFSLFKSNVDGRL